MTSLAEARRSNNDQASACFHAITMIWTLKGQDVRCAMSGSREELHSHEG